MARIAIGKLDIDPAKNPAVLDTTTWDPVSAWKEAQAVPKSFWRELHRSPGNADRASEGCVAYGGSFASSYGDSVFLVSLRDGQDLFVHVGTNAGDGSFGKPLGVIPLYEGMDLAAYPTDMAILEHYLLEINPEKAPRALGSVPRLGIGNRHTVAIWPAAFRAMDRGGFAANAVQNSLRELNLLDDLKAARPPHENYLFSFGSIAEGHTGSTFEGLFHAGVLAAIKSPSYPRYGADADHIQVKRGAAGLERAKQVIFAARHYTFFTLDVSDILRYETMEVASSSTVNGYLDESIPVTGFRKDVLSYHSRQRRVAGRSFRLNEQEVGRFVGKYWQALAATEELYRYLKGLKGNEPFDVELSIDENPPEVATCACTSLPEEILFLAVELQRRHLPLTHIAPNFGIEKGSDYRCPDGRQGLEQRIALISEIAAEYNLMLDCHSGDDLSKATRRSIGHASEGRINFKISPQQQIILAETLHDVQPDLFRFWWNDVYRFVEEEARSGSTFAQQCLREYEADPVPHPNKRLFHSYCFVSVGRRDGQGRFVNRERFYELTPGTLEEYGRRLEEWLIEIAGDIYGER